MSEEEEERREKRKEEGKRWKSSSNLKKGEEPKKKMKPYFPFCQLVQREEVRTRSDKEKERKNGGLQGGCVCW